MKNSTLIAMFGVMICLVAPGCKKGEVTMLETNVPLNTPEYWRLHTVTKDGFTICAPSNWVLKSELSPFAGTGMDMDFSNMMSDEPSRTMQPDPPKPKGPTTTETGLVLFDQGSRMLAGEVSTQIVFKHEKIGAALLKDQAAIKKDGLGKSITSQQTLQLPIGPCEEFTTKTVNISGDEVFERYYVLCHDDNRWIVKFVATNNESAIAGAPEIMATFRIK
ncbi:MAG: hypothetical protein KF784_02855 [Fimbriimonadaceae bacterium]|nr:hypothetical protein [Fimbriimonadaceae bacterium]